MDNKDIENDTPSSEESNDALTPSQDSEKKSKRLDKKKLIYLFLTVGLSAFLCAFYYCSMELSSRRPELYYFFPAVMFSYMAILAILVLVYIIYNRGFSRKGITPDMLPEEWSEERRIEFVESGERRLQRSKWLLVFIIAFTFTFLAEAVMLFVLPTIKGMWG